MSDMSIFLKKHKLMVRANYKPYLKSAKLSLEKIFIYKAQGNFAGMKAGTHNLIRTSSLQFKCL